MFCELGSIFPSNEQNILTYYVLNHSITDLLFPLLRHFLVFWLIPALTENHINWCVRMTKTATQTKAFKCPLFDWINEITSDKQ